MNQKKTRQREKLKNKRNEKQTEKKRNREIRGNRGEKQ